MPAKKDKKEELDTQDTPTTDTPVEEEEKLDEDAAAHQAKKSSDEIREERKARRLADREALNDVTRVFSRIATVYGPAFVVVDMPKVDAKAFGKDNIVASKLDIGTRVNKDGKKISDDEIIDKDGNVVEVNTGE